MSWRQPSSGVSLPEVHSSVPVPVGGQTIGKMALGTCVVDDDGKPLDATRALRRTSAVIVSFLLFGLGFIPVLFGDHRALHDRYAGTRVVRLRSV